MFQRFIRIAAIVTVFTFSVAVAAEQAEAGWGSKFKRAVRKVKKEVKRAPKNIKKAPVKVAREIKRTPKNIKKAPKKVGKEVKRTPKNVEKAAKKTGKSIEKAARDVRDSRVGKEVGRSVKKVEKLTEQQKFIMAALVPFGSTAVCMSTVQKKYAEVRESVGSFCQINVDGSYRLIVVVPTENPPKTTEKPAQKQEVPTEDMWVTPVENSAMSSPYGPRMHPITGTEISHKGVDYVAPIGTSVHAADGGEVLYAGPSSGKSGTFIKIKHNDGYETQYLHLSETHVKTGDRVKPGQFIGKSGNTGASSGPHLHFHVKKDGKAVDPCTKLGPLCQQQSDTIRKSRKTK